MQGDFEEERALTIAEKNELKLYIDELKAKHERVIMDLNQQIKTHLMTIADMNSKFEIMNKEKDKITQEYNNLKAVPKPKPTDSFALPYDFKPHTLEVVKHLGFPEDLKSFMTD